MNPTTRRQNTEQDAHNVWLLLTKGDLSAEEIRRKLNERTEFHARPPPVAEHPQDRNGKRQAANIYSIA